MDDPSRALANSDLNLLVALSALLEERSVTRAGERLALSQPTMSGALARLRQMFDDELLVRAGRTMQRTPLAETLVAPVHDILARIEQTLGAARHFDPRRDMRTFKLVATDYALVVVIRPLLQALAEEAPGVRLQIRTAGFQDYARQLERGAVDLAIIPERLTRAGGLPAEPLINDRFVAVVWRHHSEVADRLTADLVRRLPYLGYRFGSADSMADRSFQGSGLIEEPDTLVESFVVGAHMIKGTRQVTVIQERLARAFEDSQELRILETPVPTPPLVETMSWHPRATSDPAHRWLRERLHASAGELR